MDTQQNIPPVQNSSEIPDPMATQSPLPPVDNTPVIPVDPKSVLLPPKNPNVSNTPPPNYKPKRSFFKKIVKFFFTLIILGAIGVGAYFMYPKYGPMLLNLLNKNKQQNVAVEEPKYISVPQAKSIFGNINNASSIIAYTTLETSQSESIGKVGFFDTNKKAKLPEDKVLTQDKNAMYSMGPWSPNGTYLPILGLTTNQQINVYLFNSKTLKTTKILSLSSNDARNSWFGTSLEFGTWWMDENTYAVSSTLLNGGDQENIKYLTTDGKLLSKNIPTKLEASSTQLTIKYEQSNDKKIKAITVGGKDLSFIPEGNPVGIIDNMLATLILPEKVSLIDLANPNDPAAKEMEAKMTEIEKSDLSDAEKQRKTLDLIEPNGPTTLNFISIDTGNIEKTIDLTSDTWQTRSVLPHPSEKFLVVHQTNTLLQPTKERYLLVTPADTDPIKVLFEKDLPQVTENNFVGLESFQGSTFFMTNNGEWIVTLEGSWKNPETSKIIMRNISTGEIVPVCQSSCFSMRVNYPYAFVINN